MISDLLCDAVEQIKNYQRNWSEVYGPLKEKLDALTAHMDAIRTELDTPPPPQRKQPKKRGS